MDSTLCAGIASPTPKLPRLSSVTSRQVVVLRFEATQAATDERSASVEPPRPVGRSRGRTAAVSLRGRCSHGDSVDHAGLNAGRARLGRWYHRSDHRSPPSGDPTPSQDDARVRWAQWSLLRCRRGNRTALVDYARRFERA